MWFYPDSHSVFFPKASRCVILFPLHFNKFSKTLLTIFTYRGIFLVNPTDFVDWLKSIYKMWSVITVRPSTSVRKSPRKNLPPRNTPDSFCRRFTRQNHRCAAWAVFFFFTNKILCSCSIFQNLFLVVDCTTSKCYSYA